MDLVLPEGGRLSELDHADGRPSGWASPCPCCISLRPRILQLNDCDALVAGRGKQKDSGSGERYRRFPTVPIPTVSGSAGAAEVTQALTEVAFHTLQDERYSTGQAPEPSRRQSQPPWAVIDKLLCRGKPAASPIAAFSQVRRGPLATRALGRGQQASAWYGAPGCSAWTMVVF